LQPESTITPLLDQVPDDLTRRVLLWVLVRVSGLDVFMCVHVHVLCVHTHARTCMCMCELT